MKASRAAMTLLCAETVFSFSIQEGMQQNLSQVESTYGDVDRSMKNLAEINANMLAESYQEAGASVDAEASADPEVKAEEAKTEAAAEEVAENAEEVKEAAEDVAEEKE